MEGQGGAPDGSGSMSASRSAALAEDAKALQKRPLSLIFLSREAEAEYTAENSCSRWHVLALVAAFDVAMFAVRGATKVLSGEPLTGALVAQLGNMLLLYSAMAALNARSRKHGSRAAKQEEALLAALISAVISLLVLMLAPANASDYVYAALFLTCTSAVLKLRWLVGTVALAVPVLVAAATNLRLVWPDSDGGACLGGGADVGVCAVAAVPLGGVRFESVGALAPEAVVHLLVAWAVGALMAFVSDSNRRASFANHKLAVGWASKELSEVQARMLMERELAQAQQQAAGRALVVAKEKAANEAKSEFMSLMCHEVRTPLNGCLASAEMLLDTELDEEQRELAKTIRVSGSILLSTVSNFLDFFKIEAGKQLDIVRSPLDLRDLVTDVHCIIEAMVGRERGVALLPPNTDAAPGTVLGDPSRICGILLNLYTNAAKYTKRGCIGLRVRVVGANYRPDPTDALAFCDAAGTHASASRSDSRASRSVTASMPDSAPDSSRCSTPTGVLPAGGGAGAGATPSKPPAPLYQHGGPLEHDSATSFAGASAASGAAAAVDAAALLNRQAAAACAGVPHAIMSSVTEVGGWCSVHSQADPHFVMRHAGPQSGSATSASDDEAGGEQRFLCFEVMDTGVGVSRKALESLFQDYVQGTDTEMQRPRARGGTGLGLSICCKQVAVLGGALGALSKPACGSVFWFTTPLLLPPNDSSSAGSLESEEEAAAAEAAAAEAAAEEAEEEQVNNGELTPAQAAAAAAMRRSMDPAVMLSPAAPATAGPGEPADAALPLGIPTGHRRHSLESSQRRVGSGSRRQSMESDLSSMWPSHKAPRQQSGQLEGGEDGAEYHPRHALSWEQPAQPPSFTVAEMLAAMPAAASSAAAPRRPAPTGRPSLSSAVPPRHQAPVSGTGAGAASGALEAAARSRQSSSSALQGLRVLLAEDNLINQTVAKRVLTNLGCECRVASNGREAVMAVEEVAAAGAQFDVILMDMCMPVLGGVEATQEIRALGCSLPIVAMTANASERDRVECIAAGMDGFLSKPVLKEQLSVAIREAIQGGHR